MESHTNQEKPPETAFRKHKFAIIDIVLVAAIAAFLRFYLINITEFDSDQAILFRMAYDAIHHGLLPVTSNVASIGIPHPPGVIYLFMIPAIFSASPVGGAMLVSLFTTLAAVLTYLFTSRYFGRTTGLIAALLYATAATPLNYARFIWQPNLMPPFVVLYLFVLFRGVYDRRPGWLIPALPLLGILYQTHPTGSLLGVLLVAALILAPRTVRWYDWLIAILLSVVIFAPYLLHMIMTGFKDLQTLLTMAGGANYIDLQAFEVYNRFLVPYTSVPGHIHSVRRMLAWALNWLIIAGPLLLLAGTILAMVMVSGYSRSQKNNKTTKEQPVDRIHTFLAAWSAFRADPVRCAVALLLIWQIVPLLFFLRHQVDLRAQYFFILLPGPFILSALFLTWLARNFRFNWPGRKLAALAVYAFSALVIVAQLTASIGLVLDNSYGNYNDNSFRPYHNAIHSIQNALTETERLADTKGIERIYITTDKATRDALHFLAPQMKHPVTLFDTPDCFVLPAPTAEPAVLLTNPYNPLTDIILNSFTSAQLVSELPRLAGEPYKLYLVNTQPFEDNERDAFQGNLSLLDPQLKTVSAEDTTWLISRWKIMRSETPAFRTSYNYTLRLNDDAFALPSICRLNSIQAGNQLIIAWQAPADGTLPTEATITGEFAVKTPQFSSYGPLRADQYLYQTTTDEYPDRITLPIV